MTGLLIWRFSENPPNFPAVYGIIGQLSFQTLFLGWRENRVGKMLAAAARVPPLHSRTVRSKLTTVQHCVLDIEKGPRKQRKLWRDAMALYYY